METRIKWTDEKSIVVCSRRDIGKIKGKYDIV